MIEHLADEACIFCQIANGEFNTTFVAESDHAVAFDDLEPRAATHVLIVPRRHITGVDQLSNSDRDLLGELVLLGNQVARERGLADSGYRLVTNIGPDAGQSVLHLHWHLLGGNNLGGMVTTI